MAITKDKNNDNSIRYSSSSKKVVDKKLDILDRKMDELYKDIYISRPDNKRNLDMMIDNMDEVIDKLQGSSYSASGMSELLKRISNSDNSNTSKMMSSVQDLFSDQSVLTSLSANDNIHKYISGQNYNYDLICKYLPKLQDALEIKRDNVLCSDNFSKNYLNPKSINSSREEKDVFNCNVKRIENEYDISEFLDKTYMNTSKYGEDFIYIVPYQVAYERLFKQAASRGSNSRIGAMPLFEGYSVIECLPSKFENTKDFKTFININEADESILKDLPEMGAIKLHINNTNMITNTVHEYCVLQEKSQLESFKSLAESYNMSSISEAAKDLNSVFDGLNKKNNKISAKANDGLIVANSSLDRDYTKIDKNLLGAVVERIPRENILPVYIGKKCLGYYYFEFAEDPNACGFCGGHHNLPADGFTSKFGYNMTEHQQELVIGYIANRISQSIDTKFINANKDLKEEIYALLQYNNKFDASRTNNIGVTFIPAEDMIHSYFEFDEVSHRGISDLHRAVTPAMLYILLYLSDIIGKITRSSDKRIYYVKQNVETNVARTMMNVVQQIKKGNMGMRQIESMNNILNIVGKYNDYIIPMGPSGDSPIQFETMQGQEINTPTEIMEKMEEAAINTILPFELVNSTYQTDYATRFTMSNTRFLKNVYTRQRKVENIFSKIYTKIYNYEFGEYIEKIEVLLPPPTYLTSNNNSQIIDNITQMADKIIESEMSGAEDEVKTEFKRLYVRENLCTYIDYSLIERLTKLAKVNVESNKIPKAEDGEDAEVNDMMDDEY